MFPCVHVSYNRNAREIIYKIVISELEEQFRIVDLNKDGFIDAEELKMVMKNLGMKHSDEEISLMMQHADINGIFPPLLTLNIIN